MAGPSELHPDDQAIVDATGQLPWEYQAALLPGFLSPLPLALKLYERGELSLWPTIVAVVTVPAALLGFVAWLA